MLSKPFVSLEKKIIFYDSYDASIVSAQVLIKYGLPFR